MKTPIASCLGALALPFTCALQAQALPPQWRASGAAPEKYEMSLSPAAAFHGRGDLPPCAFAARTPVASRST